jgi:hypothetical protein
MTPIQFYWRDAKGSLHHATPIITPNGVQIKTSDEYLPNFFFFSSSHGVTASENASRLSDLSQQNKLAEFVRQFAEEYPWISNLGLEVSGGLPAVFATLAGNEKKLPLGAVSGGINRTLSIMLALASRDRSVMLIDEIEHGIYYRHKAAVWRLLLKFARKHESQIFLTTHDEEWLSALAEATGDDTDDIGLWRLERGANGPELFVFDGDTFKDAVEGGAELRGVKDTE